MTGRLHLFAPNWLGDAVMASEVVARAAGAADGPPVVVLREWLAPLAEAWDVETASVPRARASRALVLTESWRSLGVARRAGARDVVCFSSGARRWGGARVVRRPLGHLTRQYAALADALELPAAAGPTFRVPATWRAAAEPLLQELGSDPIVLFAPGAQFGSAKRWPAESFAVLAAALSREGARVALVGAAGEGAVAAAICRAVEAPLVSFVGRTDLRMLGGLCAAASVVVGNDSGVVHLASACGAATVGLYGSTAPEWTAPSSARHVSLHAGLACAPCFQRDCRFGAPCLEGLSVDAVRAEARRWLGARPSAEAPSTLSYSTPPAGAGDGTRAEQVGPTST